MSSMPSNGLSLSQWNSLYANQISAPPTSSLKTWPSPVVINELSTVTDEVLVRNDNVGTKVGVGSSGEVEVVRFEGQTDCFIPINALSDNSYKTYSIRDLIQCEINAQRSSFLPRARPFWTGFLIPGVITSKVTKACI